MIRLKPQNEEVYFTDESPVRLGRAEINFLKEKALASPRLRARVCSHAGPDEKVHEMLIVVRKGIYLRPHQHLGKTESYHVIEGSADLILFDEEGSLGENTRLGDYASSHTFFYRVPPKQFHTLFIHSDFFVFHETTAGPFRREDTLPAPWAPEETDEMAASNFMRNLEAHTRSSKVL
mgnify:CR=1 FL=1